MAHMSHKLPWNTLAGNFKYAYKHEPNGGQTNLIPPQKLLPEHVKSIEHFANVFQSLLKDATDAKDARMERESTDAVSTRIVSESVQKTLQKSLDYSWENLDIGDRFPYDKQIKMGYIHWLYGCCPIHDDVHKSTCDCPELDEDDINVWPAIFRCTSCCQKYENCGLWIWIDVLLTHSYMEPLYRLTRLDVDLSVFHNLHDKDDETIGWRAIWRTAMESYLVLNILYTKPDIWHEKTSTKDYRLTVAYQQTVFQATITKPHDLHTLPHRLFYGMPRWSSWSMLLKSMSEANPRFGRGPEIGFYTMDELLTKHGAGKVMNDWELDEISWILRSRLPSELVNEVMRLAGFASNSRLRRSRDPLHLDNGVELEKYLAYCWRVICDCSLLAKWSNVDIDWKHEVLVIIDKKFFEPCAPSNRHGFSHFHKALGY